MRGLRLKMADYLIVGCLLVAGLAGLWYNLHYGLTAGQKYVVISVNNRQVAELSLSDSDKYEYTFSFGDAEELLAVIEVDEGRVRMLPLEKDLCPRGICSHTGWITHSYESIVCLPNQIMVVFSGDPGDEEDIDGITY